MVQAAWLQTNAVILMFIGALPAPHSPVDQSQVHSQAQKRFRGMGPYPHRFGQHLFSDWVVAPLYGFGVNRRECT